LSQEVTIQSNNPVLVVGNGPSYPKYYDEIRDFQGKKIILDVNFNDCIKHGIKPDYVVTLESGKARDMIKMFSEDSLRQCKGETTAIISCITKQQLVDHVKGSLSWETYLFRDEGGAEESNISNAGLFALIFAYRQLKADKIVVVGFEHRGTQYPERAYRVWENDFWYYVKKWPKQTIVNCSDGGVLYFKDWVIKATLDKLTINSLNSLN